MLPTKLDDPRLVGRAHLMRTRKRLGGLVGQPANVSAAYLRNQVTRLDGHPVATGRCRSRVAPSLRTSETA